MNTTQDQALRNERLQKNKALFRRYTAVYVVILKQIVMLVQPVLMSPLMDKLTGFRQVIAHQITQNLFNSYGTIDKLDLEENVVHILGSYYPAEPNC